MTRLEFCEGLPNANEARLTRLELGRADGVSIPLLGEIVDMAIEERIPIDWFIIGRGRLRMALSPEHYEAMQGVDVPPGVDLVCGESPVTESTEQPEQEHAMDGAGSHPGSGE